MIGEDGELIGATIAVGVFADFDAVITHPVGLHVVRVVARFCHPEASALVPSHEDGFSDVGLAGKKLQVQIGCDLGALRAPFEVEGKLKREGLRALFVVGDGGARFALLRLTLSEEFFPSGDAYRAGGSEEFGLHAQGEALGC